MGDHLREVKLLMRRQQQRVKYSPVRWKDIQYARKIYFNIWQLKKLIGD